MSRKNEVVRVSNYFDLALKQPQLDFVDVDVSGDTTLFIDPRALRLMPSSWGQECVALIQDYFRRVIEAIRKGQRSVALRLLSALHEPNETHLGLSRGRARGRGVGGNLATELFKSLSQSQAVQTGLLVDLEDTALMVEQMDRDLVSDIATNIIRAPLIQFTQAACDQYGIPLTSDIDSGPLWDVRSGSWTQEYVELPMTDYGKLLLVPKAAVRRRLEFNKDEYFRYYILEFLASEEKRAMSKLVRVLKDGSLKVTKKDLIRKYGSSKSLVTQVTREHPEILERFKDHKGRHPQAPLGHNRLADWAGTETPDWNALISAIRKIGTGAANATKYHRAVVQLLTPLFYPALAHPRSEQKIHGGRKRIDISFENISTRGFFQWVAMHQPASHIFVECKNYAGDPANPELDQLAGRFSPSRGKVGILACRRFENKELFLQRCRDTSNDQRGFILPVDDEDLFELVEERKVDSASTSFRFLKNLFDELIM